MANSSSSSVVIVVVIVVVVVVNLFSNRTRITSDIHMIQYIATTLNKTYQFNASQLHIDYLIEQW